MDRSQYYYEGNFGIERETLRVDINGKLAQTPHPFGDDKYITRDFCENQIELITPVCKSIDEALEQLESLDNKAREKLEEQQEKIWLYSNPPHFETEEDIPIAKFSGVYSSKRNYREVLERRYGKRLMLFSGIHFNFSFSNKLLNDLNTENEDFSEFKNRLYMKLYKQLMCHSWLLVMLTAASPYYDASFDTDRKRGIVKSKYASMRNSERGYWNHFVPILDHSSIRAFVDSIRNYVDKGMLFSASELYLPIRLKPKGLNSLDNLARNGVDHIELRMFDINPAVPLGIDAADLKFAHLLMLYLVSLPDIPFSPSEQENAVEEHKNAALAEPSDDILKRANEILENMENHYTNDNDALEIISYEKHKLESNRICDVQ